MDELGYGFIDYAPSMAYLFAYKGYTYEKFKDLHFDSKDLHNGEYKNLCEYFQDAIDNVAPTK